MRGERPRGRRFRLRRLQLLLAGSTGGSFSGTTDQPLALASPILIPVTAGLFSSGLPGLIGMARKKPAASPWVPA